MSSIAPVPVTDALVGPLKEEINVKEVELDSNSDTSGADDHVFESSVLMHDGADELMINKTRHSHYHEHHHERRIISRTRRTSRTYGSENISKAENHFLTLIEFITSASREASSLKEFWSGITEEYYTSIEERDDLYERTIELGNECGRYKDDKLRYERDIAERVRIIQKLNKSLSEALKSVTREKSRYTKSDEENKRLRHQLHEASHKYTHLESERNTLQTEVSTLLTRVRIVEEERDSSKTLYDQLDIEYHNACQQLEDLQTQLDDIEILYGNAQSEVIKLTDAFASSESQRRELSERCEKLTIDVERLTRELSESASLVIDWTEKYNRVRGEADVHLITIGELKKLKSELSRDKQSLTRERDVLKNQYSEALRQLEQARRDAASFQKELEVSEQDRAELKKRNERLRTQLRDSSSKQRIAVEELKKFKIEYGAAKTHIERIEHELIGHQRTITDLHEERRRLVQRTQDAESDASDQRSRADKIQTELDVLIGQHNELDMEHRRVCDERDRFRTELDNLLSGHIGHDRVIIDLRERVRLLDVECINLTRSKQEMSTAIDIIRHERDAADWSRDIHIRKWDEKCRQIDRMLREGIYCSCDHECDNNGEFKILPVPNDDDCPLDPHRPIFVPVNPPNGNNGGKTRDPADPKKDDPKKKDPENDPKKKDPENDPKKKDPVNRDPENDPKKKPIVDDPNKGKCPPQPCPPKPCPPSRRSNEPRRTGRFRIVIGTVTIGVLIITRTQCGGGLAARYWLKGTYETITQHNESSEYPVDEIYPKMTRCETVEGIDEDANPNEKYSVDLGQQSFMSADDEEEDSSSEQGEENQQCSGPDDADDGEQVRSVRRRVFETSGPAPTTDEPEATKGDEGVDVEEDEEDDEDAVNSEQDADEEEDEEPSCGGEIDAEEEGDDAQSIEAEDDAEVLDDADDDESVDPDNFIRTEEGIEQTPDVVREYGAEELDAADEEENHSNAGSVEDFNEDASSDVEIDVEEHQVVAEVEADSDTIDDELD